MIKFDLNNRVKSNIGSNPDNDIIVEFDAVQLTNENFQFITQIPEILQDSGEVGTMEYDIFKLEIKSQFVTSDVKGVKPRAYDVISNSLDIQGQYRTYDYLEARKSAVYLEPIRVFTDED